MVNDLALRAQRADIISLCTGGGGLDLGIELAMPCARSVCLVEREAFAISHLVAAMQQGLLADAPLWSDVTTFNGRAWRGLVDGLIGGIPCQPHSLAGEQQGEDDERDLWSDTRRIIVQTRPWFVVIENVRGMLSSGGAERVRRDFHRMGFSVEGGLFTASEVGASHERERVFFLAVADYAGMGFGSWRGSAESRDGAGRPVAGNGGSGLADIGHGQFPIEGRGSQRRNGPRSDGAHVADADRAGLALGQQRHDQRGTVWDERSTAGARGVELDIAISERRGAGRQDHRRDDGQQIGPAGEQSVGHADLPREDARAQGHGIGQATGEPSRPMADTNIVEIRREPSAREFTLLQSDDGSGSDLAIFPPGPSDLDSWRRILTHSPELEPAVRRMADGVAARLDLAGPHAARIERLRMLGNGVVPLQAAYAFRTLATRLAARGSVGAARLVRMMEAA